MEPIAAVQRNVEMTILRFSERIALSGAILSFICLLVLCISCNRNEKAVAYELKKIHVPEKVTPSVKLSSWAHEIVILPLQTTPSSLIDNVGRIVTTDNYILISGSSIWLFDKSGNFLRTIGKRGEGPGEYASVYDVIMNEDERIVEVLDRDRQKVLTYTMDGSFVGSWSAEIYSLSFTKLSGNYYFYGGSEFNEDSYHRIYIKKDGRTIGRLLPFNPVQSKFLHLRETNNFNLLGDTLVFMYSFSDTVYTLRNNQAYPRYFISYGKYQLPAALLQRDYDNIAECLMELRKTNYAFLVTRYSENTRHIYFSFERGGKRYQYIYDKNNNRGLVFEHTEDDMLLHTRRLPMTIRSVYKDYLVSVMDAGNFRQKMDSLKWNAINYRQSVKKYPVLEKLSDELEDSDNPVLLFIKPAIKD
ncbi:MAG: 6-bladed beta-propeller [Cyclobacteriaceae bacterium]|nr:6-bladed beta-propeller [Cyclobacteriaceae bacterium]